MTVNVQELPLARWSQVVEGGLHIHILHSLLNRIDIHDWSRGRLRFGQTECGDVGDENATKCLQALSEENFRVTGPSYFSCASSQSTAMQRRGYRTSDLQSKDISFGN